MSDSAKAMAETAIEAMKKIARAAAEGGPETSLATYRGTDSQGKHWVVLAGAESAIPVRRMGVQADVGDTVSVTVGHGMAVVDSNVSNPSASAANVSRVDEKATAAQDTASEAIGYATQARASASAAQASATAAGNAALVAQASADRAQESADTANRAAGEAVRDASIARESAEAALDDASEAKVAAHAATFALSDVERVVGTLKWIAEHGTFSPTDDEEVVDGKVYYTRSGDGSESDPYSYEPVADPSAEGLASYYELELDESVQSYLAAHLWLDDFGLNLSVDSAAGYRIHQGTFDGHKPAGTYIVDPNGYVVASFGADGITLGREGGPRMLAGRESISLVDGEGGSLATFGASTVVGSGDGAHVEITDTGVSLGYAGKVPFEVYLPTCRYSIDDEWQVAAGNAEGLFFVPRESGAMRSYDLSGMTASGIAYLSASLSPIAQWNGMVAQAPPYVDGEGPVSMLVDGASPPAVSHLPGGVGYDPEAKVLTVSHDGVDPALRAEARVLADQANEAGGYTEGDPSMEFYSPEISVELTFKRVDVLEVPQDGSSLAVAVAGRGTMPLYRYPEAPEYRDVAAAPSVVVDDSGRAWVYEFGERREAGYLPLSGGTLTGTLEGTDASFSGTLEAGGRVSTGESFQLNNTEGNIQQVQSGANGQIYLFGSKDYGGAAEDDKRVQLSMAPLDDAPYYRKFSGGSWSSWEQVWRDGLNTLTMGTNTAGEVNGVKVRGGGSRNQYMIRNVSAADGDGDAVIVGNGGATIVGAGESANNWWSRIQGTADPVFKSYGPGTEQLFLTSDGSVNFITGANTVANRKLVQVHSNGDIRLLADAADTSSGTNGVSADTYRYYGVLDKASRYAMYLQTGFRANGQTDVTLGCRNFGTGANVDNRLELRVANDGTRTVGVSDAAAWRNALGASSGVWPAATIPNLDASKITAGTLAVARGGTGSTQYGTEVTSYPAAVSMASGTAYNLLTWSAPAGTWLVVVGVYFAAGTAGCRYVGITTTSKGQSDERCRAVRQNATRNSPCMICFPTTMTFSATTTVYVTASHNQGAALNGQAGIRAWRLK